MTYRAKIAEIYVDGTTYAVSTKHAVITNSSTQAIGGTARMYNGAATGATVECWAGDNNTGNEWRILPSMTLQPYASVHMPGVSIGPSQSVWVQSDTIGGGVSVDMALEDDYTQHGSGGLVVDGSTYALSTYHTIYTAAAGETWRGIVKVINHASSSRIIRVRRNGLFAVPSFSLQGNSMLDLEGILVGDQSAIKTIEIWSDGADVSGCFRGWQEEG